MRRFQMRIQNQDSVIVEEIVQNQMDKDVIDQGKKEVSVEKEIGISSVSNDSNDGIGIDQDNEVVSDEIGNDKSNVDENKLHENNEVQNSNRSYADAIGENVINFEKKSSERWEKTVCAYFVGYGMSVNELRFANKYSILDLYDETELVELQEMRNKDRVEGWNSNMNKVKNRKEVDDVYDDDSGIAECMKNDGVNGMDGEISK
ncbi:hypothetical protein Tco_0628909 [Tanacetum coccineum]|uniref:Uncharacterized protein n=1 Tax=Tanacetum coccineum TaxID=301880 RepID=A0ABQ4WRL2_9ASTR